MKQIFLAIAIIALSGCATGSNIVTGQARTPIDPSSVKIINQLPEDPYEIIGIVTASSDAGWTEQGDYEYALIELKKQAAKIGANRILIETIGKSPQGYYYSAGIFWQSSASTITGKALYVKKKKPN